MHNKDYVLQASWMMLAKLSVQDDCINLKGGQVWLQLHTGCPCSRPWLRTALESGGAPLSDAG